MTPQDDKRFYLFDSLKFQRCEKISFAVQYHVKRMCFQIVVFLSIVLYFEMFRNKSFIIDYEL
jgi:hypothetical protein